MNDKEFNRAILGKLYEIAAKVFNEGVNVPSGSYTASELLKEQKQVEKIGKRFFKENYNCECCESIAVDNFQCSFSLERIFALVSKFEKLAGISAKEKQVFAVKSNASNVLASFDVEINKGLGTLAKFAAKDGLSRTLQYICLDVKERKAVASDGHVLQVKPLTVCAGEPDALERRYPLLEVSAWKKMCSLAGKCAILTCNLVGEDIDGDCRWICECKGVVSTVEASQYPNYMSVISTVDASKVVRLDKKAWNAAKRWIKAGRAVDDTLIIKHEEGSKDIIFKIQTDYEEYNALVLTCDTVPCERFAIGVKASVMVSFIDSFSLYVPKCATRPLYFLDDEDIRMVMPLLLDEANYNLDVAEEASAFAVANFYGGAKKPVQATKSAKVEDCTPERKEAPLTQRDEPAKKETDTASKTTLDADLKKFTFDKVGVNVGDVLTFVDGTEVIAADGNKVEFCGETFTLSGFCKEFMPDEKRHKSNSYRGCEYFYKDGVKLGKLLKEYQEEAVKALEDKEEDKKEETGSTEKPEDTPNKQEVAPAHEGKAQSIAVNGSKTHDVRTLRHEWPTIPLKVLNAPMALCTGFRGKRCLWRRVPSMSRVAGMRPMNTAWRGLKVVQTLPLPPPQARKTSCHGKLLYHLLIRKQKWKHYQQARLLNT